MGRNASNVVNPGFNFVRRYWLFISCTTLLALLKMAFDSYRNQLYENSRNQLYENGLSCKIPTKNTGVLLTSSTCVSGI